MHPDLGGAQGIPGKIIGPDEDLSIKSPPRAYLERIQLLPATTRFQDTRAVAVSTSRVKRVALENSRIHVRSKN